jgi:hypothetical protein
MPRTTASTPTTSIFQYTATTTTNPTTTRRVLSRRLDLLDTGRAYYVPFAPGCWGIVMLVNVPCPLPVYTGPPPKRGDDSSLPLG